MTERRSLDTPRQSLPRADDGVSGGAPVETPTARPNQTGQRQPIRVLLISDLLLTRAGLRHLLEASGIALLGEVAHCDEAISLAKQESPDIILLDLDSRADMFSCVADLIAIENSSRVIVLSDRARSADHPELVELGVVGLVLKDDRPEVLIKAMQKVHDGEVWLDRLHTAQVLGRMTRRRRIEDVEAAKIGALTKREHEIITLVGEGLKNRAIASRLFISEATVRNHLTSIFDKLGVSDRFELAVYAFRHGLVRYPESHHHKDSR